MHNFGMLAVAKIKKDAELRFEEYSPIKLKELMREMKLTYDELSVKSEVPVPTLKKWAKGLIRPSIDNVGKLGKALNVLFYAAWPENEKAPDESEANT